MMPKMVIKSKVKYKKFNHGVIDDKTALSIPMKLRKMLKRRTRRRR